MDKEYLEELRKELEHIDYNIDNYPKCDKGSKDWQELQRWQERTQKEYENVWCKIYGNK